VTKDTAAGPTAFFFFLIAQKRGKRRRCSRLFPFFILLPATFFLTTPKPHLVEIRAPHKAWIRPSSALRSMLMARTTFSILSRREVPDAGKRCEKPQQTPPPFPQSPRAERARVAVFPFDPLFFSKTLWMQGGEHLPFLPPQSCTWGIYGPDTFPFW